MHVWIESAARTIKGTFFLGGEQSKVLHSKKAAVGKREGHEEILTLQ
jgi:hypothetical protein